MHIIFATLRGIVPDDTQKKMVGFPMISMLPYHSAFEPIMFLYWFDVKT